MSFKGIAAQAARGFPGLVKGRATQAARGFPSLVKSRATRGDVRVLVSGKDDSVAWSYRRPRPHKVDLVDEFALAAFLEKETSVNPETGIEEKFIKLGTLRHELEEVQGPIDKGCIDFIESLWVIDHTKRPSAQEALQHPWLQSNEN